MARVLSMFSNYSVEEWIEVLCQSASPDQRYRALSAILATGAPDVALHWSCHALDDAEATIKALAAKQIGELKRRKAIPDDSAQWSNVVTRLSSSLQDSDVDVRFEAARTLGRLQPTATSAREVLLSLLHEAETQPLMQAMIVTALSERTDIPPELLVTSHQELIRHEKAEVRECVTAAVVTWGTKASALVDQLVIALDDEEPVVRENAALALGQASVASEPVLAALQIAASDEDAGVAKVAEEALRQLNATTN